MEPDEKPVEVVEEVKKEEPPKTEHHESKPEWVDSLMEKIDHLADVVKGIAPAPSESKTEEEGTDFPKPGHTITDESPANKKPWTHRSVFH